MTTTVLAVNGARPYWVAQVSEPAVPPTSKSAPLLCATRVWKPATQQTWKSALH